LGLADFKVLDEGEITLPMFIEASRRVKQRPLQRRRRKAGRDLHADAAL
jgi:hypothetical protein